MDNRDTGVLKRRGRPPLDLRVQAARQSLVAGTQEDLLSVVRWLLEPLLATERLRGRHDVLSDLATRGVGVDPETGDVRLSDSLMSNVASALNGQIHPAVEPAVDLASGPPAAPADPLDRPVTMRELMPLLSSLGAVQYPAAAPAQPAGMPRFDTATVQQVIEQHLRDARRRQR